MPTDRYPRRPGWCTKHNDFAWQYDDQGVSCMYAYMVESSSEECEFVPMVNRYGVSWRWDGEAWRHRRLASAKGVDQ